MTNKPTVAEDVDGCDVELTGRIGPLALVELQMNGVAVGHIDLKGKNRTE